MIFIFARMGSRKVKVKGTFPSELLERKRSTVHATGFRNDSRDRATADSRKAPVAEKGRGLTATPTTF